MRLKMHASLLILFFCLTTSSAQAALYTVTIENLTPGIYFKNLVVAAHSAEVDLFEPGRLAALRLEWVAECGDPSRYFAVIDSARGSITAELASPDPEDMIFNDPVPPEDYWGVTAINPADQQTLQLLVPGGTTAAVELNAADNTLLTIFGRAMATNDGFVGLDSAVLPGEGSAIYELFIWDSGTEGNNERLSVPALCDIDCTAEADVLQVCTGQELECDANYTSLSDCIFQNCQSGSTEVVSCFEQLCQTEIAAYGTCSSWCEQDQVLEEPIYAGMTTCLAAACELESEGLQACIDEDEEGQCDGVSIDLLQCSASDCSAEYENISECTDLNCTDQTTTYLECVDVFVGCVNNIAGNACDVIDQNMPDLPGLDHLPAVPATGMALTENTRQVHIHRGVMGDQDPDGGKSDLNSSIHRWEGPAARVVVTVK